MGSTEIFSSGRLPSVQSVHKLAYQIESIRVEDGSEVEDIRNILSATKLNDDGTLEVKFWISMAPLERHLLHTVADAWNLNVGSFGENQDDVNLAEYLFNQWDWSYKTQAFLCEAFYNKNAENKRRTQIYNETLHILGRLPFIHMKREYCLQILRDDNKDFLANLGDRHFSNVKFVPGMNDSYYWKVLVAMYRDRPEEMEFWTNAVTRRKTYGTTVSSWKTWVL